MENSFISIQNLSKIHTASKKGEKIFTEAIKNFSLDIGRGEFITFFGPNGCGKTTFLNILAGLANYDDGKVSIDGKLPQEANIGYIFQQSQSYLLPWRTNLKNISFPLEIRGVDKKKSAEIVKELVREFAVDIPWERFPYQLSGGQQKLLSIVQAIVSKPDVLLMDEPFVGLDFSTRINIQEKILDMWQKIRTTILFVSHDIDEAIFLAKRLILLNKRPTSVAEIIDIPIEYPRDIKVLQTKSFMDIRIKILEKVSILLKQ